jgi:hypothetical protein
MTNNPPPDLEFIQIGPDTLCGLYEEKLGDFGIKVWNFYTYLKTKIQRAFPNEKLTWQIHDSAFATEGSSNFLISGFSRSPDAILQEAAQKLDPSIKLAIRKFTTNDGKFNIVFTFALEESHERDRSPRRSRKAFEEIPVERKGKSSSVERRKKQLSSESGSVSDSESASGSPEDEPFRRSKTPGRGKSRSRSLSRKGILTLEEGESKKLARELADKNALLVEVEPARPKTKFGFGFFQ